MSDPFNVPDGGPQQVGVLDIGSNSIRFVVYDIYGAHFTSVYNEKVLAGLGRGLKETGRLSEEGKRTALDSLVRFKAIADARGLDHMIIAATAAMRVAKDAPEFIAQIKARTGLVVDPISGAEEARLSGLGLLAGDPDATGLGADLGGASLELFTVGSDSERISLPLGPFEAVGANLREADYPSLIPMLDEALDALPPAFDAALADGSPLHLIGGAWRNLASIHMSRALYPLRTLQQYPLDPLDAGLLARWAYGAGRELLFDWPGLRRERAETLPFSGLLLDRLIHRFAPRAIEISLTGLREGMVFDVLGPVAQSRDALLDGCRDFASGSLQSEYFGPPLSSFVDGISAALPDVFDAPMDARLRKAACLLAGLGKNLHPDYRAELVFENVLYAPIAGLSHAHRVWLALTLFRSVSRSKTPPNPRAVELLLDDTQRAGADALGDAIRLAIVATGRTPELVDALSLCVEDGVLTLSSEVPDLLTEQVSFRLRKLADRLGLRYSVSSDG